MIIYFLVPFFLIAFAYFCLNLWLSFQLLKGSRSRAKAQQLPRLSILVCARNEAEALPQCLNALLAQDYPKELLEIWIANDRSTDASAQILQEFHTQHPELIHVLTIEDCPAGQSPKKHALSQLIHRAKGEILLNTDADCIPPRSWARLMASEFTPGTHMVLGRSDFAPPASGTNLFWGFQALDFLSHGIVAAAGIAGQIPINSTGNSLAYRKSSYEEVGGFQSVAHIISGDDDLLLHKFHHHFKSGIYYCYSPGAAVQTHAPENFRGFWEQRKRWASKTVYYSKPTVALLACVFAYYLAIILLPWLGLCLSPLVFKAGLALMASKFLGDALPLFVGMVKLKRLDLAKYYLPTALVHSHYIVAAASLGVLGKFTWKDGKIGRQS